MGAISPINMSLTTAHRRTCSNWMKTHAEEIIEGIHELRPSELLSPERKHKETLDSSEWGASRCSNGFDMYSHFRSVDSPDHLISLLKEPMRSLELKKKHKQMFKQDIYTIQKALEIIYSESPDKPQGHVAHYGSKTEGLVRRF